MSDNVRTLERCYNVRDIALYCTCETVLSVGASMLEILVLSIIKDPLEILLGGFFFQQIKYFNVLAAYF